MLVLWLTRETNLWIHVIEDTEHASLVRTWWDVTKVVCPLDFVVPESVRELKSNLQIQTQISYRLPTTSETLTYR